FRTPGEIDALAFAPNGKTIAVSSNAGLVLVDAASGKLSTRLPTPNPGWVHENRIAFSPDGKRLAGRARVRVANQSKGVVRVWDLAGGQEPRDYDVDGPVMAGWSAEGEPLAVCLEPGGLRLRELQSGRSRFFACKDLMRPDLSHYLVNFCSTGGRTLAVAEDNCHTVHVWDTATGQERCTLQPKGGSVSSLAVSPDGSKVVTCTAKAVQVWDAARGEALYTVEAKDQFRNPLFSPDGKLLAVLVSYHTIGFWDAATGKERSRTRVKY